MMWAVVAISAATAFATIAWQDNRRKKKWHAQHHIAHAQGMMSKPNHTAKEIENEANAAFHKGDLSDRLEAMTDAARHFSECVACDPDDVHVERWTQRTQLHIDGVLSTVKHYQSLLDIAKQKNKYRGPSL